MSYLFERMMVDCVIMDKISVPDGIGGSVREWHEGAPIRASIDKQTATQVTVGEKADYDVRYLITTNRNTLLEFHDIIKRVEDGALFQVLVPSTDKKTPTVATFAFAQAEAKRLEALP